MTTGDAESGMADTEGVRGRNQSLLCQGSGSVGRSSSRSDKWFEVLKSERCDRCYVLCSCRYYWKGEVQEATEIVMVGTRAEHKVTSCSRRFDRLGSVLLVCHRSTGRFKVYLHDLLCLYWCSAILKQTDPKLML